MKKIGIIFVISFIVYFASNVYAIRGPRPEIRPIVRQGVEYRIGYQKGQIIFPYSPPGEVVWGYGVKVNFEAYDIQNQKNIWSKKIYDFTFDPTLEEDVQWVFVKEFRLLKGGKILIINEKDERFEIDIPNDEKVDRVGYEISIDGIDGRDPEKDLETTLVNNDLRFIGILGYALEIVGVPDNMTTRHGYKIVEGTSDIIESEEHGRLQGIAYEYAKKYNQLLLQEIEKMTFNEMAEAPQSELITEECYSLAQKIRGLAEEIKTCRSDSDCVIDELFRPNSILGYYFLRGWFEDDGEYLSMMEELLDRHADQCPDERTLIAPPYPIRQDIRCHEGKCVLR